MKAVAFDIDDLLINTYARKKAYQSDLILSDDVDLVKRRYEKGWYSHYDTPLPYANTVVRYFLKGGYTIFFVTGRRVSALGTTIKVMTDLGFPMTSENIYMKRNQIEDTANHKKEAFEDIISKGYDLQYFFDDKESNLIVAESVGVSNQYLTVIAFIDEILEVIS